MLPPGFPFLSPHGHCSVNYRAARSALTTVTIPCFIATSPLVSWLSGASSEWLHLPGPPLLLPMARYFLGPWGTQVAAAELPEMPRTARVCLQSLGPPRGLFVAILVKTHSSSRHGAAQESPGALEKAWQ